MTSDGMRALRTLREEGRAVAVSLEGVRTVPGGLVRAAAGAAAALAAVAADVQGVGGSGAVVVHVLAVLFVVAVTVWPQGGYQGGLVLLVGLLVLGEDPLSWPRLAALVLATHLLVVVATLAARVPWGAKVELAVPLLMLRRALPVQAGLQALSLVALVVTGQGALWRIAALAAALAVVVALLPPRRRARP